MKKKVLNLLKKIGHAYVKGVNEIYGPMYGCRL